MIPVAQLDPASLTLWYSPELINQIESSPPIATVAQAAMFDTKEAVGAAVQLLGRERQARAMTIASSIWHEQRHFLDLILTNHGAFRVRAFLSLYANMPAIVHLTREPGLHCPITVYNDPVRQAVFGIRDVPAELQQIAKDVATRLEMIRDEGNPVATPLGLLEAGGDAQLETLAWIFQLGVTDAAFGPGASIAVQQDFPPPPRARLRYTWGADLVRAFGLGFDAPPSGGLDDGLNVEITDCTLLIPILIGALASRRWGQAQTRSGAHGSGFPLERLAGLTETLAGKGTAAGGRTLRAWALVNEAAEALWGRSVLEEMRVDYQLEGEWVRSVETFERAPTEVRRAVRDYHDLRGRLLTILEEDPESILSPPDYSARLADRLRPMPVLAFPGGIDPLPDGWDQVLGYRDPDSDAPGSKWTWAAAPSEWPPSHDKKDALSLSDRLAWVAVVDRFAPVAKLMINGRRHRTTLGPEVVSAEMRLAAAGVSVQIAPLYDFPEPLISDGGFYFDLTMRTHAVCDLCRSEVARQDSHAISPWLFRNSERAAKIAVEGLGGGSLGYRRFIRDWSVWIACSKCSDEIAEIARADAARA